MNPDDLHLFDASLNQSEEEKDWRGKMQEKILAGRKLYELSWDEATEYFSYFKHSISIDGNGNIVGEKLAMPFKKLPE